MRVEYSNTYTDLLLFSAAHQFRSIPLQAIQSGFALLTGVLFWLNGYVVAGLLVATISYVAIWAFQFTFNAFYLYSRDNNRVLTKHTVSITDEGLFEESPFNKSLHYWPGIVRVVERAALLAIYITPHAAHIIPPRAFDSPSQRQEFKRELISRTGTPA